MEYPKKDLYRLKIIPSIIKTGNHNLESLTNEVNIILNQENYKSVSERTIHRDLKILITNGNKIKSIKTKEGNYYVIESVYDEIELNENERKTLPIMMGLLNTEDNLSIVNWLKDILKTYHNFTLKELNPSPYFVKTTSSINFKEDLMLLTTEIIEYIKKQQAIFFLYRTDNNPKIVAPLQVRYYDGRYYLLGTDIDDKNNYQLKTLLTTYSIDNIIGLKISPAFIEEDDFANEPIYFDYKKLYKESHLELLLKHSFGIMYQSNLNNNRIKKYRFKFSGWAISYVENKIFHPSQKTIEKNKDYIIIELTLWEILDYYKFKKGVEVWDNKEVDFFVGRFGDKCERLN